MQLTFWTYVIGAAALAGVPPLAGFWSKDEILAEAAQAMTGGAWPYALAYWLLLIAAFFTAFYMTRQVLMVFFGKPRHAAAKHAPESPPVMTHVLAVLAFFAFFAGFINITGAFTHWLAPEEQFAVLNPLVAGSSIGVAALGILLGYLVYRPRELPEGVDDPLRTTSVLGWVFSNVLNPKYWVDEIYAFLFVNRFKELSRVLAYTIDLGVIDGAANGLAWLIGWCSSKLRQVQTGYVRNYALSVLLGAVIIVAYLALR
jgi:NADH-quinone oxidoreductase subunit L